jgi:hypothetical protein
VLERRPVREVDPRLLDQLAANDATLAAGIASDAVTLRRHATRLLEADEVLVTREVLSAPPARPRAMHLLCAVPHPVAIRLDRVLAEGLQLSRSRVHALAASGALAVHPGAAQPLRRPVRDG